MKLSRNILIKPITNKKTPGIFREFFIDKAEV